MKAFINRQLEKGSIPDSLVRFGIRRKLERTLEKVRADDCETRQERLLEHVKDLKRAPLAIATDEANEQHYELPTAFFQKCLGPHLKYSSGYWAEGEDVSQIACSEVRMLRLSADRAQLEDGQRILELGCGWGSLTLWMAAHFPKAQITAISNSQRE